LEDHSHVNEKDASATRYDLRNCGGDKHSMQPEPYVQMLSSAQLGEDVRWRLVHASHSSAPRFHDRYEGTNPNFYFVSLSSLIILSATTFKLASLPTERPALMG
jgi:hypothetical protein